jgi:hypothetical protein
MYVPRISSEEGREGLGTLEGWHMHLHLHNFTTEPSSFGRQGKVNSVPKPQRVTLFRNLTFLLQSPSLTSQILDSH